MSLSAASLSKTCKIKDTKYLQAFRNREIGGEWHSSKEIKYYSNAIDVGEASMVSSVTLLTTLLRLLVMVPSV